MNVPITDPRRVQFKPDDNGNHKNRRATCGGKHNQWQIQSAHYKQSLQLIKISGLSGPVCHANVQCDAASHQWEAGGLGGDSHKTIPGDRFLTQPSGSSFCWATEKTYSGEGPLTPSPWRNCHWANNLKPPYILELTCSYCKWN